MDITVKYMLVVQYQRLQDERLQVHRIFDEAHKIHMSAGPGYDFTSFHKLVTDVTQDFKRIMGDISEIESKLRKEEDVIEIADLIKVTEIKEKKKLEMAAQLQQLKQNQQDYPEKNNNALLIDLTTSQLEDLVAEIEEDSKKISSLCTAIMQ